MTIVVALKVGDGLVMGADSASTLIGADGYHNSYFNAEKLIHLKGFPVGALTFGLGALDNRSVSSLANVLKRRIIDKGDPAWSLDPSSFSVEEVVDRFQSFFHDELYVKEFANRPLPDEAHAHKEVMGFFIGGYSSGQESSEIWRLLLTRGGAQKEKVVGPDSPWECAWEGVREPIQRILFGYSNTIVHRLTSAGVDRQDAEQMLASMEPLVNGTMPIQDAADFVQYLVEVTCGYVRFAPGHATVAKPIDLAAITKYNGFKWISRKHYYPAELNV